nr:DUF5979 domain-containing protein [Corynebacterium meridianum]
MVGGYADGRPGYGKISLTKNVVSGVGAVPVGFTGPLVGDTYSVNLHWVGLDGTEHDEVVTLNEGQAELDSLPEFLKGTKATVTEKAPDDTENYTWESPVFEKAASDSRVAISDDKTEAVVTIGDNRVSSLTIRNTYRPRTASFSVTKDVVGLDSAEYAGREFSFSYTCGADSGVLKVGAGQTVQSPEFPVGTGCTVVEDGDSAEFAGHVVDVSPESSTVVGAVDGSDDVTVTNTYTENRPSSVAPLRCPREEATGSFRRSVRRHWDRSSCYLRSPPADQSPPRDPPMRGPWKHRLTPAHLPP